MRVRGTRAARLVGPLLCLAMLVAACSTPVDEAGARKVATDYYTAHPAESDALLQDIMVLDATSTTRDGHAGWDVRVTGRVVMPGLPDGYVSQKTLFVDASNGTVTEVGSE
jgi:hypothetical protein